MEIGPFIKLHRIKQNMTQEDLADGIVSESYLSKIENQKTTASPDVINLLCSRLGIQLNKEDELNLNGQCQEWFDMLFEVNSKEQITEKYEELKVLVESHLSDMQVLFEIHKIRYFLILGQKQNALQQINNLKDLSETFNSVQQYYWLKFNGNYNSVIGDQHSALRFYQLAEEKYGHSDISESEFADLRYTMSVTHSKLRNTLEVIDYAKKALEDFSKQYNFRRCAQCHLLLGISYRRIKIYDKAEKNYNLAQHLAKLNNDQQTIAITHQNLGYLHSTKGESEKAIFFFKKVVEDGHSDTVVLIKGMASIVKEYYNLQKYDEAMEMVNAGLHTLEQLEWIENYQLYFYELKTYHAVLTHNKEKFESVVIKEFLPYLKKQKHYAELVSYATMAGKHYEDLLKYKSASEYYKLAISTYEELIKI
ncbi:helix-turn-helix domain-containing protein [Radiobacillus kanasensis]|uniref:helix-turn-helix domain-containing protein n=1 Tax=Radiobacillus kanasensis TaxID=2844358 RepID=UPI001E64E0B9|nr:helix-turn-helix domain-containing protein [Radiobacillus kanasensis]UFT99926.1 helix-turn-helix domain-containing protein [Radiobacillus kanasensis]